MTPILANFLIRIYTLNRFKHQVTDRPSLQGFHRSHKFLLSTFSDSLTRRLGQIAAGLEDTGIEDYGKILKTLLQKTPTRALQTNALEHLFGFRKSTRTKEQTREFLSLLEQFRVGEVSFEVLLKWLKDENSRGNPSYIDDQIIFEPFPPELMK